MERVMSVEEKIRRAEEIYERRRQGQTRPVAKVTVNNKKDLKLLRKMFIQILICVSIYLVIYAIQNNQYVFSNDFINKANQILSYDTNFIELYNIIKSQVKNLTNKDIETTSNTEGIGGAEEITEETNNKDEQNAEQEGKTEVVVENNNTTSEVQENSEPLTQEQQDIQNIKNTTTFIKPVEGKITSTYGYRETATGNVPKNHSGTDIAANIGTKIKSATDGEVVLASDKGDYRKTFKNLNWRNYNYLCTL